jgi:hypothetical protein
MGDNRKFWEEQGEAWKPLNEKKKKEKKEPNLEAGATEDAPLVVRTAPALALRACRPRKLCAPLMP